MRTFTYFTTLVLLLLGASLTHGQVVINEIHYDDSSSSPDDGEFVELYNAGDSAVDISGWYLAGQDEAGANFTPQATYTIPASTMLAAGAYYVIGNPAVPSVDLAVGPGTAGVFENDAELTEIRDIGGNLIDAILTEANKGADCPNLYCTGTTQGYGVLSAPALAQVGGVGNSRGYFSNATAADIGASPFVAGSISRIVDGQDTNNNGNDFIFRPATPGATNNPQMVTVFTAPDVSAMSSGDEVPGWAFGFLGAPARVIDPSTFRDPIDDPLNPNPNVIPNPPTGDNRAIITYDTSGGGNGYSAPQTFTDGQGSFDLWVYLETTDLPEQTNSTGTVFRGSEYTIFNIGGTDSAANATDLSGVGFTGTVNGSMGVAWVYERIVPTDPDDPDPETNGVIEKLYLVDAGDGGYGDINEANFEWEILATVDLETTDPGWHRLSLSVNPDDIAGDANGDGIVDAADRVALRKLGQSETDWTTHFGESKGFARFDDQEFIFGTDSPAGAFGVAYRENLQLGTVTVPFSIMRPPTFVQYEEVGGGSSGVPEPSTFALAAISGIMLAGSRRRTR
jgi:hypothetical protein